MEKRARDEADLSAEEAKAAAEAWIHDAHADERGEKRSQEEAGKGAQGADRGVGSLSSVSSEGRAPEEPRRAKRHGFGRDLRITRKREYAKIYELGERFDKEWMKILALPRQDCRVRVGLTVSRRIGGAVERNRVRRLLREAIRLNREKIGVGADIVVVAKPGIAELSYHQVEQLVIRYFEELGKHLAHRTRCV